ncbi:uncharacterized protein P884DRAFT_237545 [Thermothelomyces heterothallicus CBS 202.75]|uniref:uncharacterized protein n=1 Tax=Thermothelomyces heterothallicus CBS 202.75 TaxID=1149848 RepID=UPI003744ABA6
MDHDRAWPVNGSSEGLDGLHDSMLATGLVAQPLAHSCNPESSQSGPWTTGTVPACSPRLGGLFVQTQQQGAIHPYGLPSPAPTAPVALSPDWPNHDTSYVTGAWPVSPISPTVGEAVGVELNPNLLYQPLSAQAAHALFDVRLQDWVGNANFHLDLHNTYSTAPTVSSLPHAVPPNVGSAWPGHLPTTTLDSGELPETTAFGHTTRERGCGPALRTATRRVKRPAPAPRPGESAAHQRARANHNLVEQHYRHRLHARFEALLDSLPEGILDDDDDDDQAVRGDPRGGTGAGATIAARGSGGWDNNDQQTEAVATGVGGRGGGDGGGIKGRNNRRMSKVDVLTKADRVIKFLEGDIQRMRWEMEEMKRQREVAFRRVAPMETGVEVRGNCEWNMEGR